MGMSTDGMLVYGFDLGSYEHGEGWKFKELDGDGEPVFPWYTTGEDFVEALERALLATVHGFDPDRETYPDSQSYYRAEKAAKERLGLEVVRYGHIEYSGWILAANTLTIHQSETRAINPHYLIYRPISSRWNNNLIHAVKDIGMSFENNWPSWLLTAETG
jgi:hypothetical protein